MKKYEITFTELLYLVEACYPPRGNAIRSNFFRKLINDYYHDLGISQRIRMLNFVKTRRLYNSENIDLAHFESRYGGFERWISLVGDKSGHRYSCYFHDGSYWLGTNHRIPKADILEDV